MREPGNRRLTLGEADERISRCAAAGSNSYRNSDVKVLAGLAAYPWALDRLRFRRRAGCSLGRVTAARPSWAAAMKGRLILEA
jgi:hypothetical protein